MTHLDCDHVSGVHDFKGKKIVCAREEYEYIKFKKDDAAVFGKSSDIFGDGSVIAYLTPTHSAGSVIYRITEAGKYYLLVGDNGYMEASWQEGILPGPLYDSDNMLKCLKWIKKESENINCLGVLCAHEHTI